MSSYYDLVAPLTEALFKTTGINRVGDIPWLLDCRSRRFIFEMICSEVGELLLSDGEVEEIDALIDIAIYCIDTGYRHSFGLMWTMSSQDKYVNIGQRPFDKNKVADKLYSLGKQLLLSNDLSTQVENLHAIVKFVNLQINTKGYSMSPFLEVICAANNRKILPDGTVLLNEKGKILKPEGWYGPEEEIIKLLTEYKYG